MAFPSFSDISRNFAPGWFAAVMGSGALAMTTHSLAAFWPLLEWPAVLLHWFSSMLFVVLAVPWLVRWLRFPAAALGTLRHPVQADFYPTFSIALLVLAAQWLNFAPGTGLAPWLWWAGVGLHFIFSFAVLFQMFSGESVAVDHVTPAKFIPAVGLVVMPLAGGPLLAQMTGAARDWVLTVNFIGLGAGSMIYMGLLGMTLTRKYLHKPARGVLTPTVWIHLAPLSMIPVSLANLLEQLPWPAARQAAMVFMLVFWGCAVWWLVMACLLTLSARAAGQLPFALSWWGFTFPLGSFVGESLRLHQLLGWSSFQLIAAAAWLLLCGLWSVTLLKTLRRAASGEIFQAA
jgi:C4-dicarboxylate transporter/malic acid transport protein